MNVPVLLLDVRVREERGIPDVFNENSSGTTVNRNPRSKDEANELYERCKVIDPGVYSVN